jgi:cyclic beta-1,2-glucan synthetase
VGSFVRALPDHPSLEEVATLDRSLTPLVEALLDALPSTGGEGQESPRAWLESRARDLEAAAATARSTLEQLDSLARWAEDQVEDMDFSFLFDHRRRLFHIGSNLTTGTLDPSFYDLFASEARLASFVAITKGDAPARHWMHLGRPFGRTGRGAVLLSWAGTLFEYLMPTLFMRSPEDSLAHRACRGAVARQQAYGNRFRTPWGVSESAYSDTDAGSVYQYRAFGVPDLGLHREFGDRLVVSPYSSALALRFNPRSVMANLESLAGEEMLGALGFFDALDYGRPGRAAVGRPSPVRTYMAHHQGMILVALTNALTSDRMVRRFHSSLRVPPLRTGAAPGAPRSAGATTGGSPAHGRRPSIGGAVAGRPGHSSDSGTGPLERNPPNPDRRTGRGRPPLEGLRPDPLALRRSDRTLG